MITNCGRVSQAVARRMVAPAFNSSQVALPLSMDSASATSHSDSMSQALGTHSHSQSSSSSSSLSCMCSSCLVYVPRRFGSHKVPVGPRDPDNVYRRPEVGAYDRPLHLNEDLIHTDATAPQPGLAELNFDTKLLWKAFGFGVLSVAFGMALSNLMFVGKEQKVINPEYPYNGLRLEMGGVSGSREHYPGKKVEQKNLSEGKFY